MKKRFCILQVTPHKPNKKHKELFTSSDSDFYFVTHDKQNDEALAYCPNTIWSETRNTLVELVPKKYDYYGFIDHDYILSNRTVLDPVQQILQDLEWNPAVLTYYPGKTLHSPYAHDIEYLRSRERSCIPFTHAGFKIVHHSLLNWFFPMYTKHRVDIDACHMFNIQEIPLKNVICSHKMVYDNGISGDSVYNKNGALAKYKMDEMWREMSPHYKKINTLKLGNYNLNDSLSIKKFYVDLFKKKNILNERSDNDVYYLNVDKISRFFDIENEWFASHIKEIE